MDTLLLPTEEEYTSSFSTSMSQSGWYDYPAVTATDDELMPCGSVSAVPPCALCCPSVRRMGRMFVLREDEERGLRCVVGPCWPMLCVTFSLIIVPSLPIYAFCGSLFFNRFGWGIAGLPVLAVTEIVVIVALALTACSDPGVARRYPDHPCEGGERGGASGSGKGGELAVALGAKWSYSKKAGSWRQPGVVYCSESCVLVEEIDHFCPWTGTTIGKKNLPYFNCFTASLVVYLIAAGLVSGLGAVVWTGAFHL